MTLITLRQYTTDTILYINADVPTTCREDNSHSISSVCLPGIPVACQPWLPDDVLSSLLRSDGNAGRLLVRKDLQDVRRREMEVECAAYGVPRAQVSRWGIHSGILMKCETFI